MTLFLAAEDEGLGALFFVVGYYLNDVLKWTLIGAGMGLGIGLLVAGVLWALRQRPVQLGVAPVASPGSIPPGS